MSWQPRPPHDSDRPEPALGRPGGDWQGMRPTFDNPFTWAIPVARLSGILIRVHLLFLIFVVIEISRAAVQGANTALTLYPTMLSMGCLFMIVLAHELGHCLACRLTGGQANEILMWPLGGLAFCQPKNRWWAHLITATGGPMVNLILCIVAAGILSLMPNMAWSGIIANPLKPFSTLPALTTGSWPQLTLTIINEWSLILLLFNLLPIFPLDGGRIMQAAIWPKLGYSRSMRLTVRIGYVGAILLGILGAVINVWVLVGVALFGGVTCYLTQKQLQWTDAALGAEMESDEYALSIHGGNQEDDAPHQALTEGRSQRRAQRKALQEQHESEEVDRILQKIASSGINSLTRTERSLLQRVTERKRQQQE